MPLDSKHLEANFPPTSTDLLYFRVAEVPKFQDLAIFFVDNDNDMTNYFTPCAWARGNNQFVGELGALEGVILYGHAE